MIRKLRARFIGMTMVTLFVVLSVIMAAINITNYLTYINSADDTLELIAENKGKIPENEGNKPGKEDKKPLPERNERPGDMSPEMPYETRYFSVLYNNDGKKVHHNTEHIAAVDENTATEIADEVLQKEKTRGNYGNYRYLVTVSDKGTAITFLDCTKARQSFNTFLFISILITVVGLITVFILMYFLSKRIIRPFVESQEKQKRFIADAGHEIKTPVTIIDADTEVLRLEMGDNEWLDDIRRQTKRMGSLTDDLVFLSRIDDNLTLTFGQVNISDIAQETLENFGSLAKIKGITIESEIEKDVIIHADKKSVERLLSVLLDNAVKYSPEQDVISASLKKQSKNILVTVENTAMNLDKKDVVRVFDRFYRADKSRNDGVKGYGLGLSMARAIVEAHKGKISASLTKSRFKISVTLPI
ncbi:MAG: HAMP domain-containing histidine kinase [Clostridia bacterium]|nr:HAMP domain-containing histidine kinase [Clostridia bacterium]